MNRLEQELYEINCKIEASMKREEKVIKDTHKQFQNERGTWNKRKQEILRDIRGEQELLNHVYDELE